MKRKKISAELQTRIREYLNFIWNEEKTQNIEEEEKIINSLSASLKEELNLESFGFFVKKNPLFIKFFSEDSLKKMVNAMKEIFFTPGDMIFQVCFHFVNYIFLYFLTFSKIKGKITRLSISLLKELSKYIRTFLKILLFSKNSKYFFF